MDEQDIKMRLACYRPGLDNPEDPEFSSALDAAAGDPDLGRWLSEQQAFDVFFRKKLSGTAAPDGLLDRLTMNPVEAKFESSGNRGARFLSFPLLKRMAAAAALLLIGIIVAGLVNPPATASVEDFRGAMAARAVQGDVTPADKSPQLRALLQRLDSQNAPVYRKFPECLEDREGVGCKVFEWGKHTVSLICFKKATGEVVHLFMIKREAIDGANPDTVFEVATRHGLETRGWADSDNVYVLVAGAKGVTVSDL